MVVLGQKWLYSDKSDSIRKKVVVFEKTGLKSYTSGCISIKVLVFGQKLLVFRQMWLH